MKKSIQFSVVVPVYQGEKTIEELFARLRTFFENRNNSFEVIFICDGARDNSWKKIQDLKSSYAELIVGVELSRNFGQHNATLCGIEEAQGDFIITMDEDLQHEPNELEKLIQKQANSELDIVYGKYAKPRHSLFRNFTSKVLRILLQSALPDLCAEYSSFRLIKKEIAKATLSMYHPNPFLDVYLSWVTTRFGSVLVQHYPRKSGKSAYHLGKLIRHSLYILFNFSNLPLRVFSYFSFVLFVLSTGYATYVFFRKIIYDDLISGFATIAIFLGLGFGLVFLGIGLLGEYIQNINLKNTQKPGYVVRKRL